MNKKGKEGGSTWFNRRQTELPLFKINKKKGRQGWGAGTLGKVAAEPAARQLGRGAGRAARSGRG